MKKNKLIYIILSFIILFGYKENVYAAQELTCLYNGGFFANGSFKDTGIYDKTHAMLLIQTSNGSIEIWKNETPGADIDEQGWSQKKSIKYDLSDSSLKDYKDKNGNLIECPKSEKRNNGNPIFYGDTQGKREISKSFKEVQRPHIYETNSSTSKTYSGKKCSSVDAGNKWINNTSLEGAKCLYEKDTIAGCHVIQMDITKEGDFQLFQDDPRDVGPTGIPASITQDEKKLNIDSVNGDYSGYCPVAIYVKRTEQVIGETSGKANYYVTSVVTINKKFGYDQYDQIGQKGKNTLTGEEISNDVNIKIGFEKIKILNCNQLFGDSDQVVEMIKDLISVVKIAIPIILMVLGSLDFAQAIFSDSEDKMKKAQKKFIRRLIISVIIFLVPSLLKLLLKIANGIWGNIDVDLCGLLEDW